MLVPVAHVVGQSGVGPGPRQRRAPARRLRERSRRDVQRRPLRERLVEERRTILVVADDPPPPLVTHLVSEHRSAGVGEDDRGELHAREPRVGRLHHVELRPGIRVVAEDPGEHVERVDRVGEHPPGRRAAARVGDPHPCPVLGGSAHAIEPARRPGEVADILCEEGPADDPVPQGGR